MQGMWTESELNEQRQHFNHVTIDSHCSLVYLSRKNFRGDNKWYRNDAQAAEEHNRTKKKW